MLLVVVDLAVALKSFIFYRAAGTYVSSVLSSLVVVSNNLERT